MRISRKKNILQYKLGVALSGGGARGFAHLGALKAMNEKGLFPELIAGTSAGALAGVLYADGYAPDEIMGFFRKMKFMEFTKFTIPKEGIFTAIRFHDFLKKHLRATTFEELKIPLRVVATDIEYGESYTFNSGDLIPAVIASCSIPIVFTPVEINNHHYVDGGLFANFPVMCIRDECEKLIGVNVSHISHTPYSRSMKYIFERTFYSLTTSNSFVDRDLCDILVESSRISDFSMFDLDQAEALFHTGYEVAVEALRAQ